MKSHTRSTTVLAVLTMVAAALVWASMPSRPVHAIQDSEDFPPPFGLAEGQTARLTLFNSGDTAIVGPEYRFLNSRGDILRQSVDQIVILPGQFRSIDFDLPNPPPGTVDIFRRAQIRAEVKVIGNPNDTDLRVSVEVFDNATGKTSFVITPPPEPD